MPHTPMTAMDRLLCTLGFNEPDRVPFFLLLTLHGARELGLGIREYFSKAEHVVEGQLRMQAKYGHDCLYPFFYAPIEVEAFGGEVVYAENGPPNSGQPLIDRPDAIGSLEPPRIEDASCLKKVLDAISGLKSRIGGTVPIIGVVMSPFSLPVMQMGFEPYLVLMHEQPEDFWRLMQVNQKFCVDWANAQFSAGATAICYFDPLASPIMVTRKMYQQTGFQVARQTLAAIKGPTATHLASGRSLPIIDDLVDTGTRVVCPSVDEDLAAVKAACAGRLSVLGNLNGIEMRRWTAEEAEFRVRAAIDAAGPGGGFILADNHGEIPLQVPDAVLSTIAEAVRTWGGYPLQSTRP